MRTFVVGITGATGLVLARRLVTLLLEGGDFVHLVASRAARMVQVDELPCEPGAPGFFGFQHERLREWQEKDFRAPFASGSAAIDGMVVVPCSMSTLGAIAHGISDNLLRRGAEVMLKERRTLILVPRETPLSVIHLENLAQVARAGAVVLPPVLTFYQQPGPSVDAQVDFVVARVLDHLGVSNQLFARWGAPPEGNAP